MERASSWARREAWRAVALSHTPTPRWLCPGPATLTAMLGHLSLLDVRKLVDMKKKSKGVLDSPDSGLPPSPSPSHWGLVVAQTGGRVEQGPVPGALEPEVAVIPAITNPASLTHSLAAGCSTWLCPLSFGEGVKFDPLPPKEIKYTSSVKYDSEWHFIDGVQIPLVLVIASCS
ncbi:filamin-interacting protein FAM101B [Sigmodon hispidus]